MDATGNEERFCVAFDWEEESLSDDCSASSNGARDSLSGSSPPVATISLVTAPDGTDCKICMEPIERDTMDLRLPCGCLIHYSCFIEYLLMKLGDKQSLLRTSASLNKSLPGIVCPYFIAGLCAKGVISEETMCYVDVGFVQLADMQFLVDLAIQNEWQRGGRNECLHIAQQDVDKINRWFEEEKDSSNHFGEHSGEVAEAKELSEEKQTELFIQATTKPCPECHFPGSHYHGHQCHHISPYGGCRQCKTHYCYRCLQSAKANIRERGSSHLCSCGGWSTFCRSFSTASDIELYLAVEPYPHDTRCGCPICPDCRFGKPCELCSGFCSVCAGHINPGPMNLTDKYKKKKIHEPVDVDISKLFLAYCRGDRSQLESWYRNQVNDWGQRLRPNWFEIELRAWELILSMLPNVNVTDRDNRTGLHYFCDNRMQYGSESLANLLAIPGINTTLLDRSGRNALHVCIDNGNIASMRIILERFPALAVDRLSPTRGSALYTAATSGNHVAFNCLLEFIPDEEKGRAVAEILQGHTIVQRLAKGNSSTRSQINSSVESVVRSVLELNPTLLYASSDPAQTPLALAISHVNLTFVNIMSEYIMTHLTPGQKLGMAAQLLDDGASKKTLICQSIDRLVDLINSSSSNHNGAASSIHHVHGAAPTSDMFRMCSVVTALSTTAVGTPTSRGDTCLHILARVSSDISLMEARKLISFAKSLISIYPDEASKAKYAASRNDKGETAIHIACQNGNCFVDFLYPLLLDVPVDHNGLTPLASCFKKSPGNLVYFKKLFQLEIRVGSLDENKENSLHYICRFRRNTPALTLLFGDDALKKIIKEKRNIFRALDGNNRTPGFLYCMSLVAGVSRSSQRRTDRLGGSETQFLPPTESEIKVLEKLFSLVPQVCRQSDINGDNVFHIACRTKLSKTILTKILKVVLKDKHYDRSFVSMLLAENNAGEAPLAIMCNTAYHNKNDGEIFKEAFRAIDTGLVEAFANNDQSFLQIYFDFHTKIVTKQYYQFRESWGGVCGGYVEHFRRMIRSKLGGILETKFLSNTIFHLACLAGSSWLVAAISQELEDNVMLNIQNSNGWTGLHFLCHHNQLCNMETLSAVAALSDNSATDADGNYPLTLLVRSCVSAPVDKVLRSRDIVLHLLLNDDRSTLCKQLFHNIDGESMLCFVCRSNNGRLLLEAIVSYLVEELATDDISAIRGGLLGQNKDGDTVLHLLMKKPLESVMCSQAEVALPHIFSSLIDNFEPDFNILNMAKNTCLHLAAKNKEWYLLELLLQSAELETLSLKDSCEKTVWDIVHLEIQTGTRQNFTMAKQALEILRRKLGK